MNKLAEQLDANIVKLVDALNRYPGLKTIGSCGGHEAITNSSQWSAGTWYVKFELSEDLTGRFVLEFLAWAINGDYRSNGNSVLFMPVSPPPFLNTSGKCLNYTVEGYDKENPDELAAFLDSVRVYLTLSTAIQR